jgi:hypothetical protein
MRKNIYTLFFFLLVTQICFAQWTPVGLEDESIKDIAAYNSLIFVVTSDSGKLYRSTDNGINWSTIFGLGVIDVEISPSGDVFMIKDSVFNSDTLQLFHSSDAGNSWIYLNVNEQVCLNPNAICLGPYNVKVNPFGTIFCKFAIVGRNGGYSTVAISTDNGLLWSPTFITGGNAYDFRGNTVVTSGDGYEPTTMYLEICLSEDGGIQWTSLGYQSFFLVSLKLCLNGNILAGANGGEFYGIVLSEDTCKSWTKVSTLIPSAGLSIESGGWLVGNDSLGVFLFTDDGDSLGSRNDGLTNLNIHTLTIDNNDYVYAGTDNGVWRRPLSEITAVEEEQIAVVPTEFLLSQNYPNPFNPNTKIKYSVPQSSNVVIKVFDVLGNEIETLINEEKPVGTYEVTYYATNLPSGVYFYQLRAGSFVETKKMILLK